MKNRHVTVVIVISYRYVLRVQAMKLFLEFTEKKEELQPALLTICNSIDGISVSLHVTISNMFIFQRY